MGANVRAGRVFWAGAEVPGLISASYTCSQGISPGTCVIQCQPNAGLPPRDGDLTLTDGFGSITLPACRLADLSANEGLGGMTWHMSIVDRRWRWRECGVIAGAYNQVDPSGQFSAAPPDKDKPRLQPPTKYIPWTAASPTQLAVYLLTAMGERGYSIDLPGNKTLGFLNVKQLKAAGLDQPSATEQQTLLPVNWDYVNPAHSLEQLCSQYGRRIVYRTDTNTVAIVQMGVGAELPGDPNPISSEGPSITNLMVPDSLLLVGGPIRWQIRMQLEAVGEEWNGQLRPIDQLSYAPPNKTRPWKATLYPSNVVMGSVFTVKIDEVQVFAQTTAATTANACLVIAAGINAAQPGGCSAKVVGSTVVVTGPASGEGFDVGVDSDFSAIGFNITRVGGGPFASAWAVGIPPGYANIQATDRLTLQQARGLAAKSVFKYYRVTNINPATKTTPLFVPGFGTILRSQQILLQPNRLEFIQPSVGDDTLKAGKDVPPGPFVRYLYSGFEKTKPATCWGSMNLACIRPTGLTYTGPKDGGNTPADTEVQVGFSIDKELQLVKFSSPMYIILPGGRTAPCDLVLETAVELLAPDTHAVCRYYRVLDLGGNYGTGPKVIRQPDVTLNYLVTYYSQGKVFNIQNTVMSDLDLAIPKADYYLRGAALQYEIKTELTRAYPGLLHIPLDGAISQVSYDITETGTHTRASRNSEHAHWLPSYPERLKLESQAPAQREKKDKKGGEDKDDLHMKHMAEGHQT